VGQAQPDLVGQAAHEGARNRLLQLEELSEEEMDHIKKTFLHLAKTSPRLTDDPELQVQY
jgi:hypothetical protein